MKALPKFVMVSTRDGKTDVRIFSSELLNEKEDTPTMLEKAIYMFKLTGK